MVREPIFGTELLGVGRITNPLCAKPICDILRTVVISYSNPSSRTLGFFVYADIFHTIKIFHCW